jgi:hypothetical protein
LIFKELAVSEAFSGRETRKVVILAQLGQNFMLYAGLHRFPFAIARAFISRYFLNAYS